MNYRLMAVDMDGTLLNGENQITPVTEAAIKQAMEKGLKFTLCTGSARGRREKPASRATSSRTSC